MDEQYRKAAINSGSAVVVAGLLCFFFLTDAAAGLSWGLKALAALISISVSLVCLRLYFRSGKK
jgi:hypothetical protein